jgi:hypothetical protein
MLQVLKTLHLMRIYLYFLHIALQILNCIYKKFKNGKIPYSFLPSLFFASFETPISVIKIPILIYSILKLTFSVKIWT